MSSWKDGDRGLFSKEVEYLVFEGGGGKGVLFKGAIEALEDEKVIEPLGDIPTLGPREAREAYEPGLDDIKPILGDQIKGIAGASAGAITAVLLGAGFSSKSLAQFMANTDFTSFLDVGKEFVEPWPGVHEGNRIVRKKELAARGVGDELTRKIKSGRKLSSRDLVRIVQEKKKQEDKLPLMDRVIWSKLNRWLTYLLVLLGLPKFLRNKLVGGGYKRLHRHFRRFINFYGLFSGFPAREILDRTLAKRLHKLNRLTRGEVRGELDRKGTGWQSFQNVTFEEYHKVFGIKLALAGSNVTTGSSEIFSWAETPDFPVADAARISMGIPLVFMPVQILKNMKSSVKTLSMDGTTHTRKTQTLFRSGWDSYEGYWVDGGMLNNIPIRIFDELEGKVTPTLGIRLKLPDNKKIENLADYLSRTFMGTLLSSESHISESQRTENQTVTLPTGDVGTLDFDVKPSGIPKELREAKEAIVEYFKKDEPTLAPQFKQPIRE